MAIQLKSGAVFLHVPKTGGNWVASILRSQNLIDRAIGSKHADFSRTYAALHEARAPRMLDWLLRRRLPPRAPDAALRYFTFVRNPLSWYESWFNYMSQETRDWCHFGEEGNPADWHPNSVLNGLGSRDFGTFVRNVLKKRPGYVTELLFSYTPPEVSFVGRQENLRDDLIRALRQAGERFDESKISRSEKIGVSKPMKGIEVEWTEDLATAVAALEWPSLVRYGYADEGDAPSPYAVNYVRNFHRPK